MAKLSKSEQMQGTGPESGTLSRTESPKIDPVSVDSQVVQDEDATFFNKKPERRKTLRACGNCQRAHLNCDDNRPCKCCVNRNLAGTCRDGIRKRAKYLGYDDLYGVARPTAIPQQTPSYRHQAIAESARLPDSANLNETSIYANVNGDTDALSIPLDSAGFNTTDQEYKFLASLMPPDPIVGHQLDELSSQYRLDAVDLSNLLSNNSEDSTSPFYWLDPPRPPPVSLTIDEMPTWVRVLSSSQADDHSGGDPIVRIGPTKNSPYIPTRFSSSKEIFATIKEPFSYTDSYNSLFQYLKSRFDQENMNRIAKSMARIRPPMISCVKALSYEDLAFMEQCFQRVLLEHEKIFYYLGVPTALWRRTGQIAAVGPEFCMLTGISASHLMDNTHYIVEIMDDKSVIDYFELFSDIAFSDTRGVMRECTLLTFDNKPIRTTSVVTIRRDIFGMPLIVIGNFLPILS